MKVLLHRCRCICTLALVAALALTGCSGVTSAPPAADAAALALKAAGSGDKDTMLIYLQSAKEDFTLIDTLVGDQTLGLLDDSSSSEELTIESADKYLGILGDYDVKLKAILDGIKLRDTPNHPDIASFKASEMAEFELGASVIEEYIQVLKYAKSLLAMDTDLGQLGNVDPNDLQGSYDAINKGITKAIDQLKNDDVPSFLKSMNDNMISALSDLNEAVLYTLNAAALDDPVRLDSADYRMGILTRKFANISNEAQLDMTNRETKLKGDVKNIQNTNNGLKDWVQKNIDKLGGN